MTSGIVRVILNGHVCKYCKCCTSVHVNISMYELINSTTESVDSSSLSLEGIDDVHGSDGFSSGVFSVGDGISDDSFQESLEDLS